MSDRIVECVPNFSEGRNQDVIDAISNAGRGIPGARVLGIEPDADYNRTVLQLLENQMLFQKQHSELLKQHWNISI